ncbi:MAG: LysR substrate-binding domain-containing protein [Saprospiraceae bacterium]|nr:LysR substrate-binding domain-containing protein [Saprospiraceae bacterium]
MNIQQLEYIVALDKFKSFSKAAESCFVTQATLSTMVKKLEEELEIVLFDRKTSPIITTECGKELVSEANRILLHVQQLKQIALEAKGRIEGQLRIGIIPTVAGNLLHRIIPVLLEKYPGLNLEIQEITTDNIIEQLKKGELDVGIASTPLNHSELEEDILYYEKLLVYGNVKHGNTKFRSPDELKNENVWLLEQGNCLTDQVLNVCSLSSKEINANLSFSPNSFGSLLNMVDKMEGLTLIPELFCLDLPKGRQAKVRDFEAPYPVREISLIYHRPYAKLRLIESLAKEIKDLIMPLLQTSTLKNSDMRIARI